MCNLKERSGSLAFVDVREIQTVKIYSKGKSGNELACVQDFVVFVLGTKFDDERSA